MKEKIQGKQAENLSEWRAENLSKPAKTFSHYPERDRLREAERTSILAVNLSSDGALFQVLMSRTMGHRVSNRNRDKLKCKDSYS